MNQRTLLVELRCEELPPRALAALATSFANGIAEALRADQLLGVHSTIQTFATPRRLAVSISHVLEQAPDRQIREKILPVAIALDAMGQPSAALVKKLTALKLDAVDPSRFERSWEGKTETFFYTYASAGKRLADSLQRALDVTIPRLPAPKLMRYQMYAGTPSEATFQFARPARSFLALWGETVVPASALGLVADRATAGHRFLGQGVISIESADSYARQLHEQGRVVASLDERREAIREGLLRAAADDLVLAPAALVDEVVALVEWPVVYTAHFDAAFLVVPQECLILTMQQNQRYFALTDAQGRMQNRFLLVSNIDSADPSAIIAGNERVLRARLSDAKFFFEQDKKKSLAARVPLLEKMVYHPTLGSVGDRVRRITRIAAGIAGMLGVSTHLAERAAELCKADLVTEMVGEFPELQGVMGRYYAEHDAEDPEIAIAIEDHYRPRFAGDALPRTPTALCLAMADKLEALVGMFSVGNGPTGDRDPYALRRQALGVVRILAEAKVPLNLQELLALAFSAFGAVPDATGSSAQLYQFLLDRFRSLLKDQQFTSHEIEAVISLAPVALDRVMDQLLAVRSFSELPEAQSLAAANKRIGNILRKAAGSVGQFNEGQLVEPAERALAAALASVEPLAAAQLAAQAYAEMLKSLASLRAPVDDFFANVMVMADDPILRDNRLALLGRLYGLMNCFADLSKLAN